MRDDIGDHLEDAREARLLERARVVGVLDAWQSERGGREVSTVREFGGRRVRVELLEPRGGARTVLFSGPLGTPDAARAAAAKAIESGEVR